MPFIPNPIELIADARVVEGRLRFVKPTKLSFKFSAEKNEREAPLRIVNGFRSNGVDKIAIDDDDDEEGHSMWSLQCEAGGGLRPGDLTFNGKALEERMKVIEALPCAEALTKRQTRTRALYNAFIEGDTVQLYVRALNSKVMHALILQLGYRNQS